VNAFGDLEFYSVATRLPPEFRLTPGNAVLLLETEVFARLAIQDLPAGDRLPMLKLAASDGGTSSPRFDTASGSRRPWSSSRASSGS